MLLSKTNKNPKQNEKHQTTLIDPHPNPNSEAQKVKFQPNDKAMRHGRLF